MKNLHDTILELEVALAYFSQPYITETLNMYIETGLIEPEATEVLRAQLVDAIMIIDEAVDG